jgi:hypothetical protein
MNKPWHQSLGGIIWGITRFIWAPFMAIGTPILAVYGAFHASEVDLHVLQLRSTQIPMLIGTAGDGKDCSKYTPCSSVGQRTYLVFPEALFKGECRESQRRHHHCRSTTFLRLYRNCNLGSVRGLNVALLHSPVVACI